MFDQWDHETWVCSVRGHVTPASKVAELGPEDAGFGIDVHPRWRISRCLRCDAWIGGPPPDPPEAQRLPALEDLDLPRRGKELRQAIILRIIAIERGIHSVIFALIAVLGIVVRSRLTGIQSGVRHFLDSLASSEGQTGRTTNHGILAREGTRVLHLKTGTLEILILTAAAYALIEGIEAVGLWYEKRWAEYLTAVATAGLLPLEVHELMKKVTGIKVGALVVNVAVLVYLVYAKRLFGVRRHAGEKAASDSRDPALFSPPY
ncbi:MAG: DUF2127 domain-containing protein [Actinomycetota bacterium]|nr:DUF2127 domain-containing protein [Actinomycetota bacterium]